MPEQGLAVQQAGMGGVQQAPTSELARIRKMAQFSKNRRA